MAKPRVKPPVAAGKQPRRWWRSALDAAGQRGPYPLWITGSVKAVVAIGLLTAVADWAARRSAKADLTRLVEQASRPPAEAAKAGSTRR